MPPQTIAHAPAEAPSAMTRREAAKIIRGTSYKFLKTNKDVLWIPVIHGIVISIIAIAFVIFVALPAFSIGVALSAPKSVVQGEYWAVTAVWYFVSIFVIVFFQASLMSIVKARLSGEVMTVGAGFHAALARLHKLFLWALISATVGLILHILANSHKVVAQIIGWIIGATWSVTTYFALPGIALDNMSPFAAMKNSMSVIKRTWGESILSIGGVFLGLWALFILFMIVFGIVSIVVLNYLGGFAFGAYCVLFVIACALFTVVVNTLGIILKTVLYEYASDGKTFSGFAPEMLATIAKKKGAL